ncbi:hypothetical protein ATANTOWER_022229 [Ataeniobius toweri]|uniref:Uncharacterized protein n=1 Tax=Ataeniobius toweri TaxID=208326 RepID=A0ABU7BR13_9TELE|nr:hypothetical protein [Ataeniobius toweri]
MDPETRDPGTYHSPSRGPTEPRDPGPGKQPSGVSRHTPKHHGLDTENHKYTSGQRHQPPVDIVAADGSLNWSRRVSSPRPNLTQKTGTHSHNNTFPLSCIHTHAPNVKTNNNGLHTLTHTPHTYSILPGPGADTP